MYVIQYIYIDRADAALQPNECRQRATDGAAGYSGPGSREVSVLVEVEVTGGSAVGVMSPGGAELGREDLLESNARSAVEAEGSCGGGGAG
jgi:hypothetical protein